MKLDEIRWSIIARAGASRRSVEVMLTADRQPPSLQHYNPRTGKPHNRKRDFGKSSRRVVVGLVWMQEQMPEAFAVLCAHRITTGELPIKSLDRELETWQPRPRHRPVSRKQPRR